MTDQASNGAYYDPKSRSMRMIQNSVSGDTAQFKEMENFVEEVNIKNPDLHVKLKLKFS